MYCSTCQKFPFSIQYKELKRLFQLFILVKRVVTRKSSTHGDQFYQLQFTIGVALLEADTMIHIRNVMCNKNKQIFNQKFKDRWYRRRVTASYYTCYYMIIILCHEGVSLGLGNRPTSQ